jgi:hypothetical protein
MDGPKKDEQHFGRAMRIHLQGIFNHESDSYGFHEAG